MLIIVNVTGFDGALNYCELIGILRTEVLFVSRSV